MKSKYLLVLLILFLTACAPTVENIVREAQAGPPEPSCPSYAFTDNGDPVQIPALVEGEFWVIHPDVFTRVSATCVLGKLRIADVTASSYCDPDTIAWTRDGDWKCASPAGELYADNTAFFWPYGEPQ